MKATIVTRYGPPDVLQVKEVEKPSPKENEVLIKVHASTVIMGDCEIRGMTLPLWTRIPLRLFMGFNKPRKLVAGAEFSGVVEAVGGKVTSFREGDHIFGTGGMYMGANAEYMSRDPKNMAVKPVEVSHEDAATLPVGGINALHFLRKANIRPGQKVLIIGGGGSIGTYAVQLAKNYGAEVTAVDSGDKLDMLLSLGADHVIDYTRENYFENDQKYDVIFDLIYSTPFSKGLGILKDDGCYLLANPSPVKMIKAKWSGKNVIFDFAEETPQDLRYLATLLKEGKIKSIIDKCYPLEQVVEAHRYVESGHKKGCLVLKVADE
ncbi:NAD(P)-dependent alcohol dehydrogenase [Fulvivirga sp. 29W222]|uniref:NAD(P)-dependent alcohol dehydrogenase n=1 Tax=Fulvivirga marina TaxID=2494733 RepID=A0A937KF73_9BACT|nr:NAD(P)-dependent alcohol dehydrogenase [Fulvivirga marina]MBL6447950.1 NAD(P)-dependent alcohol dehydrogenase [Fulvivirga marina]